MKFEQVLQIYWTKGFLFGGKVLPFDTNWRRLDNQIYGFGLSNKIKLLKRFELTSLYYNPKGTFKETDKETRKSINRVFSQMTSINYQLNELNKFNIVRLFLIKTFRGKAQAFGKPSRGQRTWSNAWTSYLYNKELRVFIAQVQAKLNKNKKEEKINYKLLKKKTQNQSSDSGSKSIKVKRSVWF